MKIIAIMGSPRGKGSGYKIVKMIEERMIEMGDVDFEYLFLKDANLKSCIGCYNCMAKGEEKCPFKDDRAAIEQKLLASDGFILSSPVYVDSVSWLMKNFIDRFAYMNHRPRFHRQKVLTVVNMAGSGKKETLLVLKKALGGARGARIVHKLAIATPPWPQTERAVAEKEQAIDAAAKKFYLTCLDTSLPLLTFSSYMDFLIMQKLSLECQQYLPADYAFYNGKTYYFDTSINPIKAAAAKAIAGVIMNIWKKGMGPGNVSWPVAMKEEKTNNMKKIKELISRERSQYPVFIGLSIGIVVLTGILYFFDISLFWRFIGTINPLAASFLIVFLGFISLSFLLSKGWFTIYKKKNLKGLFRRSSLAALFALITILVVDLNAPFPADMNVFSRIPVVLPGHRIFC